MLTLGAQNRKFEQAFAAYTGSKNAIAVNSGTSALEIILRAIDVKGKEVIIPTNTFAATIFAAICAGATVRLCDMDEYFSIDPEKVRGMITPATKAVVVVHIGGMITPKMAKLQELCRERGVVLVEDAAHAHGSTLGGKQAGTFGDAASFSFYPTKVMTSGEGGMIITDSEAIANKARVFRDQGKESFSSNRIVELGYNWRMSEIHAIIGAKQLEHLAEFIGDRRRVAAIYDKGLEGASHVRAVAVPSGAASNYYKYLALLDEGIDRAALKKILKEKHSVSLSGEVYDVPCHLQPAFAGLGYGQGSLPDAERLCSRHICLPLYAGMADEEAMYVVDSLKKAIAEVVG